MSFARVRTYYLVASVTAVHMETFTEVSKPKYIFHAVFKGVYILHESMYRSEYIDTHQCSTMKCYPQDVFMPMKC